MGGDDRGLLSQLSETQAAMRSLTAQYEASVAREHQLQAALTGAEARCAEEQQKQAALMGAEARCAEVQAVRLGLQQQLAAMLEEAAACRCEVAEGTGDNSCGVRGGMWGARSVVACEV